jgi:two-component sensor histidine kinase
MALHELATNATKHGALSAPGGRLRVSWTLDRGIHALRLRWSESGGPAVAGLPARRGFGSRVIEATIRNQLGGTVRTAWKSEGLVCEIEAPLAESRACPGPEAIRSCGGGASG